MRQAILASALVKRSVLKASDCVGPLYKIGRGEEILGRVNTAVRFTPSAAFPAYSVGMFVPIL